MKLITESYLNQAARWPKTGKHILAQFDTESIVVYQAYRPSIGRFAAQNGYFGGEFNLNRMSWIKPNFLWMMYRSGWGTKLEQEITLAIHLKRSAFEVILAQAVHSSFIAGIYTDESEWKSSLEQSEVRLQWDPDHHPSSAKLERRAVQLGLRGNVLAHYTRDWIIEIEDISDFVAGQRQHVTMQTYEKLMTPRESVYPIANTSLAFKLEITPYPKE